MADPGPSPYVYDIDPASGLALAKMRGVVTGTAMLDVLEAVHGDPRWSPGFEAIWDCSDVTSHVVSPPDVRPIVLEAVSGGRGNDVLIPSPRVGDDVISDTLAVYSRRLGKRVVVRATLHEAIETLGRDGLPEALGALVG